MDEATPRPLDETEEILAEVLGEIEAGADLDELLARYAGHAEALRRRLDRLGGLGLAGGAGAPPPRLGPYALERPLGRGGMAEVWLARDLERGETVALKVVAETALGPSLTDRFGREARALGRIDHRNVVAFRGAGRDAGFRFIAMEHVDGRSLADLLREDQRPPTRRIVAAGRDLARALAAAHAEGLVHRDLKPSNVIFAKDGRVVLIDFGLTRGPGDTTLSLTGRFIGSPQYASPEQIRGEHDRVGPASDVYSLGVTLYEALAGAPPFEGAIAEELFRRILTADPPRLRARNAEVSADLEAVIDRAMEKRIADRYGDAASFAADLEAVLELRSTRARPASAGRRLLRWCRAHATLAASLAVLVAVALAALGVGFYEAEQRARERRDEARSELGRARDLLATYVTANRDLPRLLGEYHWIRSDLETRPAGPGELAGLDARLRDLERAEADRVQLFTEVMDALRRAESADPRLEGAASVRARLYLERWREARADRDEVMASYFAGKVREHDVRGEFAALLARRRTLSITTDPPGARVDAFVYRRHDALVEDGEPRLVPVPWRGRPEGVDPGARVLRVRAGPPPLRPEDLILEVDGHRVGTGLFVEDPGASGLERDDLVCAINGLAVSGPGEAEDRLADGGETTFTVLRAGMRLEIRVAAPPRLVDFRARASTGGRPARVWRDGEIRDLELPRGSVLRLTAAPLFHGRESFVGFTPLDEAAVEGDVILLVRAEGREPVRYPAPVADSGPIRLDLDRTGDLPPAFVRALAGPEQHLRIMDREVTCDEYLAFLREGAPRAAEGRPEAGLLPLDSSWLRDDGTLARPDGAAPDAPICGVSWSAAKEYARWFTRRSAAGRGEPRWTFDLPPALLLQATSGPGGRERTYPWGNHFRSSFAKSCFSRARPRLEPGLRFPVDETVAGVFDLAGSAAELCEGWFWEERGLRPTLGGSWAHGEAEHFRNRELRGIASDLRSGFCGFRLVAVPRR